MTIKKKTESEWKKVLSTKQYKILREKGTELPFSGKYNSHFQDGVYLCAGCNTALFDSKSKF
jgi:peptide-methionine (R)-S-oxide reductase